MGSDDGVEVGNIVYISDVLVGRIVSVSRTQSQVALFSSRDAEPVLVQTASGAQGLLVGNGTRTLLTQIPVQVSITTGERLTTVGQQGIPPGQFIGVVASVSAPGTAPMQTALIDQLQSFYTVPLVEIR
jgi:cell shape-determining protein MreC